MDRDEKKKSGPGPTVGSRCAAPAYEIVRKIFPRDQLAYE
jgi:hypothetical protein